MRYNFFRIKLLKKLYLTDLAQKTSNLTDIAVVCAKSVRYKFFTNGAPYFCVIFR